MISAMISVEFVNAESGSMAKVDVSMWRSSDQLNPGPRGKGRGKGGESVIVTASGRFSATAKVEKLVEVSPRPGRKMMALVGELWGGGWWILGWRLGGSLWFGGGRVVALRLFREGVEAVLVQMKSFGDGETSFG